MKEVKCAMLDNLKLGMIYFYPNYNQDKTKMKISLKSPISFSVMLCLALLFLSCCCFNNAYSSEEFAYLETVQQCEGAHKEQHSDNHKDCRKDCGFDQIWEVPQTFSLNNSKLQLSFCQNDKLDQSINNLLRNCSFSIVNQDFPDKIQNTVPTYLQHSVLRI